jgi:hypothetical protein
VREPFVAVPKSLYDALILGHFGGNESKVVWAVVRYTFGHYDRSHGAAISMEHLSNKTGIHDRTLRAIVKKLLAEGVLLEIKPKHGRTAATLAVQRDAGKWGIYSPNAPPRRAARGNPEKLREHQFSSGQSGRTRPDKSKGMCGHGGTPVAGMDARADSGRERPHSEDLEEGLLKSADCGGLEAPPLSSEGREDEISIEEGREQISDYLAQHSRERADLRLRCAGTKW